MQRFFAVLAVVVTLLLGVIALELYPIARIAGGVLAIGALPQESDAQKKARLVRQFNDIDHDANLFMDAAAAAQASRQKPARPTQPSGHSAAPNIR
jgi:hypothetical protein